MRWREHVHPGLFVLLVLIVWLRPSTAGEQPDHDAKNQMHHPKEWRFSLPKGDPVKGRKGFARFECYSCHQVVGENFPDPGGEAVGPELSQMGPMHPLEFFAESVLNPDAVIIQERYRGQDGRSMMRSLNNLIVQELIDLAAFLKSLGAEGSAPPQREHGH